MWIVLVTYQDGWHPTQLDSHNILREMLTKIKHAHTNKGDPIQKWSWIHCKWYLAGCTQSLDEVICVSSLNLSDGWARFMLLHKWYSILILMVVVRFRIILDTNLSSLLIYNIFHWMMDMRYPLIWLALNLLTCLGDLQFERALK